MSIEPTENQLIRACEMETKTDSAEPKSHGSLIVPCATVFISSFCIMVLELVAGRILARYLGSSLYTWTSVIGIVLGGITIGNYIGGRLADHFQAGKTLSILFAMASVCCVATIVLNNLVGRWTWLWGFAWPLRTVLHVSFVFLLPSTLLGTISPVVAKAALERGLPVGRTVGAIYAWGAVGSIAGTFLAGYYLVLVMGATAVTASVASVLAVIGLLFLPGLPRKQNPEHLISRSNPTTAGGPKPFWDWFAPNVTVFISGGC